MANQYKNKVVYNGNTLIDLTSTTATADKILSGYGAFGANGAWMNGTASGGGHVTQDANGYIVLPATGGGGGGDSWSWVGKNPLQLKKWTEQITFADLGLDQWEYSTTSTTIRAVDDLSPPISVDLAQYDVWFLQKIYVYYDYGNWTPINTIKQFSSSSAYLYAGTFPSNSSVAEEIPGGGSGGNMHTYSLMRYYTSNGAESTTTDVRGIFSTSPSITTISSTGASFTIRARTPVIKAQGNTTYFTQTAFENLDMNNSYYALEIEAWRVDRLSSVNSYINNATVDVLNNGL